MQVQQAEERRKERKEKKTASRAAVHDYTSCRVNEQEHQTGQILLLASCIIVKPVTACLTWDCVGSIAVTVADMQLAVDGLAAAADEAPAYACLSSICSPCMLLYMVRKPRGCLTEAGIDLMLPLDTPLQQVSATALLPAAAHIFY